MNKGKMTVYGCGGCGINIIHNYLASKESVVGVADIVNYGIDTSLANVPASADMSNYFILPDSDGSGAIRKKNYEAVTQVIKQIPVKFKPGDLSVVVFSAGGGSGSVIGPLLMRELLTMGKQAIAIVVGSSDSLLAATNTLNTISSMDAISRKIQIPLILSFECNFPGKPLQDVDGNIATTLQRLSVLISREHHKLDTQDIATWAHYERYTDIQPQLTLLEVVSSVAMAKEVPSPISIASIVKGDTTIGEIGADYQTTGYFRDDFGIPTLDEVHYLTSIDDLKALHSELSSRISDLKERQASRPKTSAFSTSDSDDSGMIL